MSETEKEIMGKSNQSSEIIKEIIKIESINLEITKIMIEVLIILDISLIVFSLSWIILTMLLLLFAEGNI
jgi:hypothetical protein